jgi:small-conductance mechanosensitive channel
MFNKFIDGLYHLLMVPIMPVGKTVITVWMLLYVGILLAMLITVCRLIRDRAVYPALAKSSLDVGAQHSIGLVAHYVTVGVGALIILNTAGIETTALTVVAGAVGLGLSLGLQTIAKNFVGGVVLLFERPIKLGDRIQIAGVVGDVTRIALRSTTLKTADQTEVVIPNGDFMNEKITNWNSRQLVLTISISVPNDLEPESVCQLLLDAAANNPRVVKEPAPQAWLDSFGEKNLMYQLRVTTGDLPSSNGLLKSELNLEIYRRLKERLKETEGYKLKMEQPVSEKPAPQS